TIQWVTGLQGDTADVESDGAFTLEQRALAAGEHLTLGATARASEQVVPWFSIDGGADQYYAALMWSGAWSLDIGRNGSALAISLGLAPMATTLQTEVDGPHVIFGAAPAGAA